MQMTAYVIRISEWSSYGCSSYPRRWRCGVGLRWPSGAELLRLAAAFAGELLEARPYVVADQRAGRLLQLLGHHRRRCRQALGRQGIEEVAPPQAGIGNRQAAPLASARAFLHHRSHRLDGGADIVVDAVHPQRQRIDLRSEQRREGEECVSTGRYRWS